MGYFGKGVGKDRFWPQIRSNYIFFKIYMTDVLQIG